MPAVMVTGAIGAIVSAAPGRLPIVRCSVRTGFLLIIFVFGVVPLFTQAPRNSNPQGVIRITVNLVQVDAVVTDSKGHQVTSLRPEDFEILEDGRPQTITNFSYISVATPLGRETHGKPPALPAGVPSVSPVRLRPEQVRRTIAIVVDDLHIRFENIVYARRALKEFVDADVQPGDLVAILRTAGSLGVLQQFTNDKRLLYAAIDRIRYVVESPCGLFGRQSDLPLLLRMNCQQMTTAATFNALDYVVRGLRDLPGRKALILAYDEIFLPPRQRTVQQRMREEADLSNSSSKDNISVPWSDETPEQRMRELADLANRSSTVIYTIDTRGLPTLQLSAGDDLTGLPPIDGGPPSVGPQAPQVASTLMDRTRNYLGSMWPMAYLAHETGGIFVHDNNDLAGGMREIMDDLSGYYLIGYKPPGDTFKTGKNGRGYHQIQVKVKVRSMHVRSRAGFYGVPDDETRPVYRTRHEQLRAAVASPFGASGVHVELASQVVNEGRKDSLARLWLHIDARDLTLQDAPDGTKKSAIDVLGLAFGDNGVPVAGLERSFGGSYQSSELDGLRNRGSTTAWMFPSRTQVVTSCAWRCVIQSRKVLQSRQG
jgi:VWFA-related protein